MPSRMLRATGFAYFLAGQTQARQSMPTPSRSTKRARWLSILRDCRSCLRSSEQVSRAGGGLRRNLGLSLYEIAFVSVWGHSLAARRSAEGWMLFREGRHDDRPG